MKVLGSRLEVGKEAAKTMRRCIYIYTCIKHYFKRRARTMRKKKKKIHDIITSACIVREGAPWPM